MSDAASHLKTIEPKRVFLAGASGTIGRAVARALIKDGHRVVALLRPGAAREGLEGAEFREGEATDPNSLASAGFRGEAFDAVVSCLASRNGAPADAWAVDHGANLALLGAAKDAGAAHFVLLSAICVQKPRLEFQRAKLAFEEALIASGLTFSIVRPTAYFKSLSGQAARVKAGKPFLLFGDGALTATKPISDDDLARFIADCLIDSAQQNRILPVGGPGPVLTAREQGEALFAALGRPPKFKSVPPGFLKAVADGLSALGTIVPALKAKAEFARIGHYYGTESMLVWDEARETYDAAATPEFGTETLADFYEKLVKGDADASLGDHKVF
ncbi:MAG: NAD(P)H-binding protein [Pseudomonadota bacterium]